MAVQKLQLVDDFTSNHRPGAAAANIINLSSDTLRIALFQSTSNISVSQDSYDDLTNEVANGNGYTTGGVALANVSVTQDGNALEFTSDAVTWTASGGSITARTYVIYSDTPTNNSIIGFGALDDTPADVTVTDTNTLTLTPPAATGWLTGAPNNA